MNHINILSRALKISWQHRALWLFGFLFALAGGGRSGGGGSGGGGGGGGGGAPSQWQGELPPTLQPSSIDWGMVAVIILIAIAVIFLLSIVMAVLRYVAETAMIAGVDEIEGQEARFTIRRGFQLGWSRQAWRMFLADLIIHLPILIPLAMFLATGLLVWATFSGGNDSPSVGFFVALIALILPAILFMILIALAISIIRPYIQRRVVLGKQGVVASIKQGLKLVRLSLLDTGLMWLLLVGVGIAWTLVMIPVFITVVVLVGLISLAPAGLAYLVSQSWIAAAIVGAPIFLLLIIPLMAFVQGLFELYNSSVWTLTYREVLARHAEL
ncbi:MAG: hypothetical protein JW850_22400 [Thermoflexales bacterium]|nr:hypothetical protein [Thermoflexales bacterium]